MSNRWFGLPHPPGQIRLLYGPTHSELTQNPVLPLPSLDSLLQHHSTTIINPHRSSVNLILPLSQHQNHHTQLP
uniref:Uncharacterized protein n=1 Tax=Gossypium raimondii TaxID=29730 RepID=A0A0D2RLB7_GOSRA|nr:hypothetical protein B456_003G124200 [Gossypium raimondii]